MNRLLTIVFLFSSWPIFAQQYPDLHLNDVIALVDQKAIGISKLNDLEKDNLRVLLIEQFRAGYEERKKVGIKMTIDYFNKDQYSLTSDVIESQIDGAFEGWEGETIVKLMNGQIWQQTEYYYHLYLFFYAKGYYL